MELVLPWEDSNFDGSPVQKEAVYANLKRVGFQPQKWKVVPSVQIVGGLGRILPGVLEKRWQLVCSNSVDLLQAIAELSPIVFSLTTRDSSLMITTDTLASRIQVKDDVSIEWTEDMLKQIRTAGLLCWVDVTQAHSSGGRYHYRFSDLLLKRKALGYPTIFLCIFIPARNKPFDEGSVESVFNKIRVALGDTAAVLIQEMVDVQYLEVELKPNELVNIKL